MTVEEIEKRIASIQEDSGSASGESHEAVDSLWEDVLVAIAGGADNARELAAAALKTEDINYYKWYS